jgi:hypothetical protein
LSVTFSDVVAAAIREGVSQPGMAGRRLVLSGLFGLSPGAIFDALANHFDRDADVDTGAGVHSMRAITLAPAWVLLVYLVDETVPTPNSGSAGFAATLRTQFLSGAEELGEERTLLVLDERPVETVLSATEDAAELAELRWAALVERALHEISGGIDRAPILAWTAGAFAANSATAPDAFDAFCNWAAEFVDGSQVAAGSELWKLGCFISDPDAHTDAARLSTGAAWRRRLDERYASQSKSWETEARKLLAKVAPHVVEKVIAAAGPFGLDYTAFTLTDLQQADTPPSALHASEYEPARNARAALVSDASLVVWLDAGATALELALEREIVAGDSVAGAWADGSETSAGVEAGKAICALPLPAPPSGWVFGRIELSSAGRSGTPEVTQSLPVAVFRSDGDWFPVENRQVVDDVNSAFISEGDPSVAVYGPNSRPLGSGQFDVPDDDEGEIAELAVSFGGVQEPLPCRLVGDAGPDDPPEGPEIPGDPEDPPGPGDPEPEPAQDAIGWPSIPHALLDAGKPGWPEAALHREEEKEPWQVAFTAGQRRRRVRVQRPGGLDGAAIEQAILDHPEWTGYVWTPALRAGKDEPLGTISRAPGLVIPGGELDEELTDAFMRARAEFFELAKDGGSVYAADPSSEEARAYVAAYRALLESTVGEERYRADWDALLLCDAVFIAGQTDVLVAPTSPLAVGFHAGLLESVRDWIAEEDAPPNSDVASLSLRHALPLVHVRRQWYESAPLEMLLWRRYVPLSDEAPGIPERNAAYIAERLRFFLRVHPAYLRADQVLSVAFYEPPSAAAVFSALRSFYARERQAEEYRLPRLQVWMVGGPSGLERDVLRELAGGRQDDLDRLVQSRVTVTVRGRHDEQGRPFAHVSFLFSSPGDRASRQLDMADRPATTYLGGLASAPGRKVYPERHQIFAWGTWAGEPDGDYLAILRRGLELVGGQPAGRVSSGWTQMASTTLRREELDELYKEKSIWVVHLDRLIGIEAFGEGDPQLIDYEERADPDQPGYDGITATEQIEPYLQAVGRALGPLGSPKEQALRRLLQLLNAVSGRWAIELLQRGDTDILQRIGFVGAISALEQLDRIIGSQRDGTGVLIALDELIAGRPHAGLPRFTLPEPLPEGRMCDDLLLLWIPAQVPASTAPVTIRGAVVEVKYASTGRQVVDTARLEIERTREWLERAFNRSSAARPFRARDLAELITAAAARAEAFSLGRGTDPKLLDPALRKVVAGEYVLDLRHWRAGQEMAGLVISVEAESSVAAHAGKLPPPGDPVGLVRLGLPVLRQLVSGGRIAPAGGKTVPHWAPMTFEAPAAPPEAPEDDSGDAPGEGGSPEVPPSPAPAAPAAISANHLPPAELAELAQALEQAMEKYRLATEPFQVDLAQVGPNVIRFRTRPLGPLSVADVERRARDIGREIGAPAAVIVSQEPRYICIDVPREQRTSILYRDIDALAQPSAEPGALNFILGVAPSGEIRSADLARLPHLLVAGATGSGKSVFLRGLLCHLVRTRGPAALRILLIDPKQLDFAGFATLPHLEQGRIISDPSEAMLTLQETIERELDSRRPVLIEAGVTSATEFYESGGTPAQLPQMVVLVDEFADLVGVLNSKERKGFDELIQRYAQLTRAFGIYLVLATQRPSVDVVTGSIKANLTARVALSLPSHRDSMTILDRPGAEDLLGNGDMLFYHSGRVERLQGAFADQQDVRNAAERWRGVPNPGTD